MTNRVNYDSVFCGNLPIHQINLIQPHGALMILDRHYKIVQVSENVDVVFQTSPEKIVNNYLSEYVTKEQFDILDENVRSGIRKIPLTLGFSFENNSRETTAFINVTDEMLIIELESISDNQPANTSFTDVYQRLKFAMAAIEAARTTKEVSDVALKELRKISGFDKLMIYQFDKDWNGAVIAELKEPNMESYLGLVFPASDIPKQARELYKTNPYRLIPNVDYAPVKLYPLINPITNGFLDLSQVGIRAVAAVHLEYMRNMGIKASMSTRILNADNTLWGLISCHHLEAKFLNHEVCTIFELMSTIISARIAALQTLEEFRLYSGLLDVQAKLLQQVYSENDLVAGLINNDTSLLQLVNADSVVILYNKKLSTKGDTPARQQVEDLVLWLKSMDISKVYHEESLSDVYEQAVDYAANGSGILVIPINPSKGDFIIFFRQEAKQKISWGGNPAEAIQYEKNSLNYHPRNSFKRWQETVAHTSLPWGRHEINIAEQFQNLMMTFIINNRTI